jgi:hypothetical protein
LPAAGMAQQEMTSGELADPLISGIVNPKLANARPEEATVALYAHLATVQKVRHRGNGLSGALRARTHGQDQIAKGKLGTRSKDKSILLH